MDDHANASGLERGRQFKRDAAAFFESSRNRAAERWILVRRRAALPIAYKVLCRQVGIWAKFNPVGGCIGLTDWPALASRENDASWLAAAFGCISSFWFAIFRQQATRYGSARLMCGAISTIFEATGAFPASAVRVVLGGDQRSGGTRKEKSWLCGASFYQQTGIDDQALAIGVGSSVPTPCTGNQLEAMFQSEASCI